MTQRALAKALGVVPSQITYCKRKGMPTDSVEDARAWREAHIEHHPTKAEDEECFDIEATPEFVIPEGSGPHEILSRLQVIERSLAGQLVAWTAKLTQNPTNAIASKLTLLRKEHREAAKMVMVYEKAIMDLATKRGELVSVEASDAYTLGILSPIITSIKGLPRWAKDENERALLAAIGKRLLAEVSTTSAMAARASA
jgi:hypothetical protein